MEDIKQTVYDKLEQLGIPFQAYEHAPAYTMQDCQEIDRVNNITASHCKNLFLCNRVGTEFYLLLMKPTKKFKTADISKQLGKSRLSFGKEDKLYELLHCVPGAISAMGLLFDKGCTVNLLMDEDLFESDEFCFHPCINTASLVMSKEDLFDKIFAHTGHMPRPVRITTYLDEQPGDIQ